MKRPMVGGNSLTVAREQMISGGRTSLHKRYCGECKFSLASMRYIPRMNEKNGGKGKVMAFIIEQHLNSRSTSSKRVFPDSTTSLQTVCHREINICKTELVPLFQVSSVSTAKPRIF